ncbi:pentapeptide repeat-containing protein [Campylobacter concisus]|uniref:pentapeptide repeat-containing protein n=1 Tax=Campylobacter concisus TaxID=199 RepID=UPI000D30B5C6|nr:pentapeptide repeat-containing protein [Campylobacter concisus]
MGLDIDKILQAPKEEIGQNDLKRLKGLGIISENIYPFNALERSKKQYWVKKCEYDGQSFFIFYYFVFDSDLNSENNINLEKYLQSDEPNIILQNCLIGNQKDIKNLNKIKQAIIAINSEFPNISSCEFENEVFLRDISNNSTFGGCEFAKKVYVDGYAFFQTCTFNGDFISANAINGVFIPEKNAKQDISFANSIFNKSFELVTKNELEGLKFEAAHFKQEFNIDIQKFKVLDFSSAEFDCELNLHARQFDGININFTNAKFNQKLSFNKSIINCEMLFKEACFESDLIFTEAKFDYVVNLDKSKFKGKAQFRGTKFSEAILTKTTFENKADFSNAKFNEKAYFTNAVFKADADFSSATFADEARFLNANFKGVAIFKNAEFKAKADFKTDINLTFGKDVNFSNTTFQDNAYFNNRVFEEFVDFHEADFKKVACFYSVAFKKPVNFSSIIFNGALNFVNAKTDFTYEELKELIETQIKRDKSIDNINRTNDFRDGFRLMKYNLNNKGNALDASLFHRLELYCKELELEFTLENTKDKNSENDKKVKSADNVEAKPKSKNRIELFLDLITLKLYRNTSDHHTNLLRIINFMVLTIAVYGFYLYVYENFILTWFVNCSYICSVTSILVFLLALSVICYQAVKHNIAWGNMLIGFIALALIPMLIVSLLDIKYVAYIVLFVTSYLLLYYFAIFISKYDRTYLIYYTLLIVIFFIEPFLIAPFISIFTSEQAVESKFKEYAARYNENGLYDMLLDANLTNAKKDDKLDFIVKNRKIILDELDDDKALLNDFVEKLIKHAENFVDHNMSNKNIQKKEATRKPYAEVLAALKYDEIMQSTQKSANLLYGFIMLLVVYSLTKTARKNSVVPS